MSQFSVAWRELGDSFRDADINTFRLSDEEIRVLRPSPGDRLLTGQSRTVNSIATVPLRFFDAAVLTEMLSDLEQTKRAFAEVKRQCDEMGDPL
jgi:hypothetical protein